jgi:hypothetical protein
VFSGLFDEVFERDREVVFREDVARLLFSVGPFKRLQRDRRPQSREEDNIFRIIREPMLFDDLDEF